LFQYRETQQYGVSSLWWRDGKSAETLFAALARPGVGHLQCLADRVRGQDVGFQKAIDNSPRKRHHVRFWALSLARAEAALGTASFWLNTDRPPTDARVFWIGAGTRDTGFSLTQLTFQITHATDTDTTAAPDYIINELTKNRSLDDVTSYPASQHLPIERVNRYVTDGEVAVASLVAEV